MEESEKINKYLDLARELSKLWNMKVKVVPIVICSLRTIPKALEKNLGELEIRGSPGDLRRLAVTQPPVNHRLRQV